MQIVGDEASGRVEQEVGTGPMDDALGPKLTESVHILPSGLYYTEPSVFEVKSVPQTGGSSTDRPSQSPLRGFWSEKR